MWKDTQKINRLLSEMLVYLWSKIVGKFVPHKQTIVILFFYIFPFLDDPDLNTFPTRLNVLSDGHLTMR